MRSRPYLIRASLRTGSATRALPAGRLPQARQPSGGQAPAQLYSLGLLYPNLRYCSLYSPGTTSPAQRELTILPVAGQPLAPVVGVPSTGIFHIESSKPQPCLCWPREFHTMLCDLCALAVRRFQFVLSRMRQTHTH